MPSVVVKVENISKQYRLGIVGSDTLRDDFTRFFAKVRGREDPFLKIDQNNTLSFRKNSQLHKQPDYVWALRDVNLEVKQGEVLGIIGKNGAGKSTLLKILSKVTLPSSGQVKIKGRIASLLEVGTGFHAELTGRENIYLNGAILGMTRSEIKSKIDEIIDFSDIERYIDTPVKRYSSGMYVRLAFAVAAHLEPEILIVDEVLAVGDAEFQKKCLGKMQNVSSAGRTVIFVSHDMQAVSRLVKKCILLQNGMIALYDDKDKVIDAYLNSLSNNAHILEYNNENVAEIPKIQSVKISTSLSKNHHKNNEPFEISVDFSLPYDIKKTCISIIIKDIRGVNCLAFSYNDDDNRCSKRGKYTLRFIFQKFRLYMGAYSLTVFFAEPPGGMFFQTIENICHFNVLMYEKSWGDWDWQPYLSVYMEDMQSSVIKKIE